MSVKKLLLIILLLSHSADAQESLVERGEYLLYAGGCITCHTAKADDAVPLAGGHKFVTAFGTFYAPNITPDVEAGIGGWSDDDFVRALHEGRKPDGGAYFPAFPFPAFTGMTREDALAIKAFLFTLEPVSQANIPHDLPWFMPAGLAARVWQWLFFDAGRFEAEPDRSDSWNRGAYLVRHLGHCGECHTPRSALGALKRDLEHAGSPTTDFTKKVPNITPDETDGIGTWSADETELFLQIGILPNGDFTGGAMSPVIDDNTGRLTDADRQAIVEYLQSRPPLPFGGG